MNRLSHSTNRRATSAATTTPTRSNSRASKPLQRTARPLSRPSAIQKKATQELHDRTTLESVYTILSAVGQSGFQPSADMMSRPLSELMERAERELTNPGGDFGQWKAGKRVAKDAQSLVTFLGLKALYESAVAAEGVRRGGEMIPGQPYSGEVCGKVNRLSGQAGVLESVV